MTLIVESGNGDAAAESYISVADADARHTAFGNTAWAALTTPNKETALRVATGYMVQAYRQRWSGMRRSIAQSLDWPRVDVCIDGYSLASDIVPDDIANACADLALKASTDTLAPDVERAVIREKIGPLETEYAAHGPQETRFRAIDMALAPYLKGSSAMAMLVRA